MAKSKYKLDPDEQDYVNVIALHGKQLDKANDNFDNILDTSNKAVKDSEDLLKQYSNDLSSTTENNRPQLKLFQIPPKTMQSFDEAEWKRLVQKASDEIGEDAKIEDILLPQEIKLVEKKFAIIRGQFDDIHRLDKVDWLLSFTSGTLATLIDVFLVQLPKHPGFLGGKSTSGGPLSNFIRERVQQTFSPEEIRKLERENWAPYDPSTSIGLESVVEGLGPRTHRFQSLGHDPILGFIFGVRDILSGSFTAIDTNGEVITQAVGVPKDFRGMGLFNALIRQFGHLKSDVSTPAGLPAPLMPLLQLVQFGSFGKRGYSLGELSRAMYRQGYDFSHFLSMSIPVLIIEAVVRGGYFFKRRQEGFEIADSIPFNIPGTKHKPKLQTMLFTAHTIATTVNVAKTAITQNPLAVNYAQWMMFLKSLFSQLNWALIKKEELFSDHFIKELDGDWNSIHDELDDLWKIAFNH